MNFTKKIAVTLLCSFGTISAFSQNLYVRFAAARNFPTAYSYQEQISESYYPTTAKLTFSQAEQNFGKGSSLNGAVGYNFNKYLGAEFGLTYLVGGKNNYDDIGFATRNGYSSKYNRESEAYARMLYFQPAITASLGKEKFNPYVRLGITLANGTIYTHQEYSTYQLLIITDSETTGDLQMGFQGSLGVELKANKHVSFYAETTYTNFGFVPAKKTVVTLTENGKDILPEIAVRDRETEYVDSYDYDFVYDENQEKYFQTENTNEPKQEFKQTLLFNSIGFGVGVKCSF
jgi:opacity protein-like surface antigen